MSADIKIRKMNALPPNWIMINRIYSWHFAVHRILYIWLAVVVLFDFTDPDMTLEYRDQNLMSKGVWKLIAHGLAAI